MTGRLQDKVAIITGSTSGIGRETARVFAREGAKVIVNGRRADLGQEAVDEILAASGEAHFIHADVSDHTQLKALVDEAVEKYGRLDIMMNNAWGGTYGNVVEVSEEQLDRDIAILRTVEALRLEAAHNGGRFPQALSDIKRVPIPRDPLTGKAFIYTYSDPRHARLEGTHHPEEIKKRPVFELTLKP